MAEDTTAQFIGLSSTQKDDSISEVSDVTRHYEVEIRKLFVKIASERDYFRDETIELKAKLQELLEEKAASDERLIQHKENAEREITELRANCLKLVEQLQVAKDAHVQAAKDAQPASDAATSTHGALSPASIWRPDGCQVLVETISPRNDEALEQHEPMTVNDEIVVSDG